MPARCANGFLGTFSADEIPEHVKYCIHNEAPTCSTEGKNRLVVAENEGRAHVGQRPLTCSWGIWMPDCGFETGHAVPERKTESVHRNTSTESVAVCEGQSDDISLR